MNGVDMNDVDMNDVDMNDVDMNDDVQEVRAMLAPANPVPRGGMAGSADDGFGRAARARIVSTGPRSRTRTWTVRVAVAGGLAVAIAGGTTVVQNIGGTDGNGKRNPGVPAVFAGPVFRRVEPRCKRGR